MNLLFLKYETIAVRIEGTFICLLIPTLKQTPSSSSNGSDQLFLYSELVEIPKISVNASYIIAK